MKLRLGDLRGGTRARERAPLLRRALVVDPRVRRATLLFLFLQRRSRVRERRGRVARGEARVALGGDRAMELRGDLVERASGLLEVRGERRFLRAELLLRVVMRDERRLCLLERDRVVVPPVVVVVVVVVVVDRGAETLMRSAEVLLPLRPRPRRGWLRRRRGDALGFLPSRGRGGHDDAPRARSRARGRLRDVRDDSSEKFEQLSPTRVPVSTARPSPLPPARSTWKREPAGSAARSTT